MRVIFQGQRLHLIITGHARARGHLRRVSELLIKEIIRTGEVKMQLTNTKKLWAYKKIEGRIDNLVAVALTIDGDKLVVITVLVGWRPT